MAQNTTKPVGSSLEWSAYCAALGVDPNAARDASLVKGLHSMLANGQLAIADAMKEASAMKNRD